MFYNSFQKKTLTQLMTGTPISLTFTPVGSEQQRDRFLLGVYIHFSAAVTETVTITRLSADGTAYDTVIKTSALTSATDFSYEPITPLQLGDCIKVQVTAATATANAGVTIIEAGR